MADKKSKGKNKSNKGQKSTSEKKEGTAIDALAKPTTPKEDAPGKPIHQDLTSKSKSISEERALRLAEKRQEALQQKLKAKEERETERERKRAELMAKAAERLAQTQAMRAEKIALRAQMVQEKQAKRQAEYSERKGKPKSLSSKPGKASSHRLKIKMGLGLGIPDPVRKAWQQGVKISAKQTLSQSMGYLQPTGGGDAKTNIRLDLQRKKLAQIFEKAIMAVFDRLMAIASESVTTDISWDEKNRKLRMSIPAFGLSPEIKRSLKGPMQEFAANIAEKAGALQHFPALSHPIMLQFFGDLDTGQQMDGSISFMLDESVPGSSKWEYRATLTGSGKKSSEPAIVMKFVHDLDLAWGEGQISAVQWVPEEPVSEKN